MSRSHRTHARPSKAVPLMLAVLASLLAACGSSATTSSSNTASSPVTRASDTPSSTPKAAPDPCSIITQAEAEAFAQTPLQAASKAGEACNYFGAPTGPTARISVFVGDGVKTGLDTDKRLGHTLTPLPGVGDEAYIETDNAFVRKGTVWVELSTTLFDVPPDQIQSGLQTLITKIAAKL